MERLTTNKSVADMLMIELAHNSCYADDERNARYRDYDMEMDARDFTRNLMATLTKDELPVDDAEFDEEILDNLMIDPFSDVRGLIALFYRNLWAMADLREKLKYYEDADEHGLLLRLQFKVGDTLYRVNKGAKEPVIMMRVIQLYIKQIHKDRTVMRIDAINDADMGESCYLPCDIGERIFLTREEAEAKLKEMEEKDV
jgi:hypothetical protein